MARFASSPPAPHRVRRSTRTTVVGTVAAAVTLAAVGCASGGGTYKVSQAAAKDDVNRTLDAMVQAIGASRQDYTSAVILQHCDNGMGGYDGWQVYSDGVFQHQTRDGAATMADTLSAYLRRAGYSGVKQTADARSIFLEGTKSGMQAILGYDSSNGGDEIDISVKTACDIVPDPAVATTDQVKIG